MLLLFTVSEPFEIELGIGTGTPVAFDAALWLAIALGVLFLVGSLVYSFSTHSSWQNRKKRYLFHRQYETHMPWILVASRARSCSTAENDKSC